MQRDDHKSLGKEVLEASPSMGSFKNYVDKLLPIIDNLHLQRKSLNKIRKKLEMLKSCPTSVTFLSPRNVEAAPEEAMQLRRLIKS